MITKAKAIPRVSGFLLLHPQQDRVIYVRVFKIEVHVTQSASAKNRNIDDESNSERHGKW